MSFEEIEEDLGKITRIVIFVYEFSIRVNVLGEWFWWRNDKGK